MKIAILGMGTVGGGVLRVLQNIASQSMNQRIEIEYVFAKEIKDQTLDLRNIKVTDNLEEILASNVELVVEVLGGIEFPLSIHRQVLASGKHIVTANKDLLALHLDELAQLANDNGVQIGFEASCGGGIPIVQPLQWNLNANRIHKIMGILNGTTNYILTKMTQDHWSYQDALAKAQALGYAEKDPTNDVGGFDASRKIAILSRLAYDRKVSLSDVTVRGIETVELEDILHAEKLGYVLKLVGKSEFIDNELMISVEPVMLPYMHMLASTNLEKNAIYVEGDAVGQTMFYGPGAGSLETASAVVSDILWIEKFGFVGNPIPLQNAKVNNQLHNNQYYLRLASSCQIPLELEELMIPKDQGIYITKDISLEQLKHLKKTLQPLAYYVIEGETHD